MFERPALNTTTSNNTPMENWQSYVWLNNDLHLLTFPTAIICHPNTEIHLKTRLPFNGCELEWRLNHQPAEVTSILFVQHSFQLPLVSHIYCTCNQLLPLISFATFWITQNDDDVVLRHTLPVFTGLGRCPIVSWDFVGAVSIFGPGALPVVH